MRCCRASVVALLLVAVLGCGKKVEPVAPTAPVAVQGASVAAVAPEPIPDVMEAVGTVKAKNSAVISARLSGTVNRVLAREGDRVAKGQVLAAIDAVESEAAAAGAVSGVEEAARALAEARSRKKLADATFERYRRLFADQAVTRQEFETRQSEQEVATQGVARAEASLAQARQQARSAGAVAAYGKVTSPLSGTVIAKQVEAGQTVFPGTPLFTVEGGDGYRLEVSAPEGLLGKVQRGDQVSVSLDGTPSIGAVSEVVPLVDPGSRTFIVKIDLPSRGMRAGRYGKALFKVGSREGIVVPRSALVERGALTSVWTVSPQGIARLRLVKLGRSAGDRIEVISGLSAGERIVTSGTEKVTDGAKVQ